jgi:hypothetical protein
MYQLNWTLRQRKEQARVLSLASLAYQSGEKERQTRGLQQNQAENLAS